MWWLSAVGLCVLVQQVTFGQEQLNNDNSHINIAIDDRPGVYYEQVQKVEVQKFIEIWIKIQIHHIRTNGNKTDTRQ